MTTPFASPTSILSTVGVVNLAWVLTRVDDSILVDQVDPGRAVAGAASGVCCPRPRPFRRYSGGRADRCGIGLSLSDCRHRRAVCWRNGGIVQ